jgi:hypothetical protein
MTRTKISDRREQATRAQVDYLLVLARKLGMDRNALHARLDIRLSDRIEYYVSRTEASEIIDTLRDEVG